MTRPVLRQFGDLTEDDFRRHPIWIACHGEDADEPLYDDTDEETFRPRPGVLPADPAEGMLVVRATARLRDGTRLSGFLTPGVKSTSLGTTQPCLWEAVCSGSGAGC